MHSIQKIIIVVIFIINQVHCEAPLDIINNIMSRAKMNYNLSSSSTSVRSSTSISSTEPYEVSVTNKIKLPIITETSATVPSIKKSTMQSKIGGPSAIITSTTTSLNMNLLPLPPGASAVLVKPTKYHYYPHNQHIYLLPECAIQQVCNAVYVRLNWTQPLCACPSRYRDPCSASLNSDDLHTTKLITGSTPQSALTLVKTCEPVADMRLCRSPRDWSLLALQNIRTGKSHYLVICRCPESSILEGPMSHDQPTYASVPGIRVYGMMCVQDKGRTEKSLSNSLAFPWKKVHELFRIAKWD